MSWLSLPVIGFGLLVPINTLFLSPAYTPSGLYHPLLLVVAFLVARSIVDRTEKAVTLAALGMGIVLALWGLAQIGPIGMARARAFFETPATYAAVLNLLLVPALAAMFVGKRSAPLLVAALVLATALFAADSRGALLALAAGLACAAILAMRAQVLHPRAFGLVLALLAAGWILATVLRAMPSPQADEALAAGARAESSLSRLELYALSWNAWREQPLTGTGYLTFRYKLEQGRAQVPSYGESNETWFVHNDYLQSLQELGPIGLLALLGLTVLPPVLAYRRLPSLAMNERTVVLMAASALAAMAAHACVDFPFFIPVCLVLYGVLLGALDRRLGGALPAWSAKPWFRPARTAALAIAVILLLRPVLAEAAAEWGLRRTAFGEEQSAAFWLGTAQRLDPEDWRYHWYAGQFWDAQAAASGKREAAQLAAAAYDSGFAANPLEVRNLLGMISVNRRHRALLDSPVDDKTLRDWLMQAAVLAPMSPAVQRELAK